MNIIIVVWDNDVLIPVAVRWKYWVRHSGGRKIIIIPMKGIVVQKVNKSNERKERLSSVKSKHKQPGQQNWFYEYKAEDPFRHGLLQKYKYQTDDSQINLPVGRSKQPSVYNDTPRKPAKRPFTWSTRESINSKKVQPTHKIGTIGGPSSPSELTDTQPDHKVRTTDDPSSREHTKIQRDHKVGTPDGSSSREPNAQPGQKVGATGSTLSPTAPKKMQSGQGGGSIGSPPSSTGPEQKSPKQPTSGGSHQPTPEFSQFEKECLDEHNRLRAIHNAPPLTLSRNLCNYAQEWANHLVQIGGMEHRTEGKYGENLFMSGGLSVDPRMPVKSWYDEIQFYTYGSDFTPTTGHFTQVVWKDTKEMGCAFAQKGNEIYVVANYSPPGNVRGQFSENVLPPKN